SASCPQCNFDLARANAVMGPVPRLSANGLTDLTGTLEPADERRLHAAMRTFHRRFPQSKILVVVSHFAAQFPLSVHLFWLFNSAGLSAQANKLGNNRDILIGVDPHGRRAGLTIGYGLEPFLRQETLDGILERAMPQFSSGEFTAGMLDIIDSLSRLFESVSLELPDTFGLRQSFAVEEQAGDY
ncbi:MAG: hypothetical protein HKO57_05170, partial [Akkermansiaceae bacterium]|nr:hypothetical protein [Akkermansiaceae bacterium]